METIIIICAGILGVIVGSFLNVIVLRFGTGRGIGGRSECFSCGKTLRVHELIPVVSFLLQNGKCWKCHSRISWQYPIVELATGILFAGVVYFVTDLLLAGIWLMLVCFGVVISVYDVLHKIILIGPLIAFFIVALFVGIYPVGAIMVVLPFLLLWLVSGGKWIGFGDVEIMVIIGMMFGVVSGYSAIFLAFWIACIVMIPTVIFFKWQGKKRDPEIPFGPFLFLGIYLVGVCGLDVVTYLLGMVH